MAMGTLTTDTNQQQRKFDGAVKGRKLESPGEIFQALGILLGAARSFELKQGSESLVIARGDAGDIAVHTDSTRRGTEGQSNMHIVTGTTVDRRSPIGPTGQNVLEASGCYGTRTDAEAQELIKEHAATPAEAVASLATLLRNWCK